MNPWLLAYEGFDPKHEGLREALCTLGNGYFATRGAAAENEADDVHYPGTYLAGGYNRLTTEIAGRAVEHEDLVNLPNWLLLTFRVDEEPWFNPLAVELLSYRQELDLRAGILTRALRFRDRRGRITRVSHRRLVHMDDPHLAALETRIEAEDWSGEIEVCSALDARVVNAGVARYRGLNGQHLEIVGSELPDPEMMYLEVQTNQSKLRVALAARTRFLRGGARVSDAGDIVREPAYVARRCRTTLTAGESLGIEKVVALFTSRDHAILEWGDAARAAATEAGDFEVLLRTHRRAWDRLWRRFDVEVDVAPRCEESGAIAMSLRLHVFHLLQTVSPHTMDLDIGVPARGWHGEAYRGHVFWDELFIVPFLNLRLPATTRALLSYRYRRLPQALRAAQEAGHVGAMFPWQSGSDGREESQLWHLNPRSGRWTADASRLQRHVGLAIAHNVWRYYQVTRDSEFLWFQGAELMLQIARFWASLSTFDARTGRYEIRGVMGPDEYHDAYPGADERGLRNNAYTNLLAASVLHESLQVLDVLPADRRAELAETLQIDDHEVARWDDISRRLRVVFHGDGIISQFEGYEDLVELDWEAYRLKYGDIHRLDRILEAEGDSTNRYKVSKQADVLMLFYLFSTEELSALFARLGYPFEPEMIPRNIEYYLRRTCHGSTLSRIVHSWVLARSDRLGSWKLFTEAAESDLLDIQGGTTSEGIHLGAMAGTLDFIQRGTTGIVTTGDVLSFNPRLPDALTRLRLHLRYRGQAIEVEVTRERLRLEALRSSEPSVHVGFKGQVRELRGGDVLQFPLITGPCATR